jgi:phosphatidylserine/phosphatidylglycerophosphate/cardiolipin synthase-like enzyme
VTIDSAVHVLLERLSESQVQTLADAAVHHPHAPRGLPGVVAGGDLGTQQAVRDLLTAWRATPGLTGAGVALALRLGSSLHRQADDRRGKAVWTGPDAPGDRRLTSATLHGLLAAAKKRILLVSFAAFTLPEIATDLSTAVERGCDVDVVFETSADSASYDGPATPFAAVGGIRRWRWPKDQRPPHASLHAKLLVVDGRRALVGSANLTSAALMRNLEAGVLIRDETLARDLETHVRGLMSKGILTLVDA